jgi:hypothetical protein
VTDDEDLNPEDAERRIGDFIADADLLPGPSVADLADAVAVLMEQTWDEAAALLRHQPRNKVLATQFLLSRRAMAATPDDPEQWRLHAGSTLLSGMVVAPVAGGD